MSDPRRRRASARVARPSRSALGVVKVPDDFTIEFPDGETVLLTELCEGQEATVLQVGCPVRFVQNCGRVTLPAVGPGEVRIEAATAAIKAYVTTQ